MAATLKIMSWNVERFNFIVDQTLGYSYIEQTQNVQEVCKYVASVIKAEKPNIVCFQEFHCGVKESITTALKAEFDDNKGEQSYGIISSPAVIGGGAQTNGITKMQYFCTLFNTVSVIRPTGKNRFEKLLQNFYQQGSATNRSKTEHYFTRKPFWVELLVGENKIAVINIHANASNADCRAKDAIFVSKLASQYTGSYKAFFLCGDMNDNADKIKTTYGETSNMFKDALSKLPNQSSVTACTTNLKYNPPAAPENSATDYRNTNIPRGVDDIISLYNKNDVKSASIVDLIKEGATQNGIGKTELDNIDPKFLLIPDSGGNNQDIFVRSIKLPTDDESTANKDKRELYNSFLRYRAGISDHLPVVMTIDIP